MTQGILVDPFARTVEPVEFEGNYRRITELIQCAPSPFDAVYFPKRDVLYVDDEGLLKKPTNFFMVSGYEQLLAGRGLFLGTDREGNTGPLSWVKIEWLRDNVAFFTRQEITPGLWGWSILERL